MEKRKTACNIQRKGYNISYKYTDGGIRKNKTVNGQTTEYLLNGGEILQERRGNGDILTFARDESGSIIAVEYYSETTDLISYYYYIKNLQGDVIGISDREGNTVAEYRYDSWGRLLSVRDGAGNDISENAGHIANINPIRYRGYYYDSETGFYYLQSRYYDPETRRFLNADGYVSTGQGMTGNNMFAYCGNNPVMYTDPSGELFGFAILGEILLKGLAVTAGILIIASVINAATPEGKRAGSEIGKSLYSAASSVAAAGSEFAKSFAKDYNVGKSNSRTKEKTITKTAPPKSKANYWIPQKIDNLIVPTKELTYSQARAWINSGGDLLCRNHKSAIAIVKFYPSARWEPAHNKGRDGYLNHYHLSSAHTNHIWYYGE